MYKNKIYIKSFYWKILSKYTFNRIYLLNFNIFPEINGSIIRKIIIRIISIFKMKNHHTGNNFKTNYVELKMLTKFYNSKKYFCL